MFKRKGMWPKVLGIVLGLLVLSFSSAWALNPSAGTVSSWSDKPLGTGKVRLLQISYVTDASAGTFTVTTDKLINAWILKVQTDPGDTAPTPSYDIDFDDSNGEDIMGGALDNRSDTVTESTRGLLNGNYQPIENFGKLTIQVTAAGNSRTMELLIWYLPF